MINFSAHFPPAHHVSAITPRPGTAIPHTAPRFSAKPEIPKERQDELIDIVNSYIDQYEQIPFDSSRTSLQLNRAAKFLTGTIITAPAAMLVNPILGLLYTVPSIVTGAVYRKAIQHAKALVRALKEQGITSQDELHFAVNTYMSKIHQGVFWPVWQKLNKQALNKILNAA